MREPETWDGREVETPTSFLVSYSKNIIYRRSKGCLQSINFLFMDNKKKNEELQSRRDFFKKTAKSVLPILGAVVLASVPTLVKAEEEPMGCKYGCAGACYYNCYGCSHTCTMGCADSCNYNCKGGCKGACLMTCEGSCRGTCTGSCSGGCTGLSY